MKILVMGLPNSGKTTLAKELAKRLNAVHWDADAVRKTFRDLTFSVRDRVRQAQRMRFLCNTVVAAGHFAIADFVCPTFETREAFGPAFTVWVDRISLDESPYLDTRELFQAPHVYDFRYTKESTVQEVIDAIQERWASS